MTLKLIAQRIMARAATPVTPEKNVGLQRKPASLLGRTPATPETPQFNETRAHAANDPAPEQRTPTEAKQGRATVMRFDGGIDHRLATLLAQHGGFDGVDWSSLALTDATTSSLWIVRRPADGKLTVFEAAEPTAAPLEWGYLAAWPARRTWEPPLEPVPAEVQAAAAQVVERARQKCWTCKHLDASQRPTCARGHPVGWQLRRASGSGSYPRRLDSLDCGDQDPRP